MHPLALSLLLLAPQGPDRQSLPAAATHAVRGLRAGEHARLLGRVGLDERDEERCVRMRVLDASTGLPLEGARVEAWTEPGTPPAGVAVLVDEARSGPDGGVRVRVREGGLRGDKLRLSRPGYESRQCSPEPGAEVLLAPAQALRGRVLDLELQPIEGATVRSRQGCAHGISASETRTGADGSFVLEDFPVEGTAELEVIAPGCSPRGELDALLLRQQAEVARESGGQGCTILLARVEPWRVRLLDVEGRPLAGRCVWTTERPVLAQWTDKDGMCAFVAPEASSNLWLETCDAGARLGFSIPMPPREVVAAVRAIDARPLAERAGRPSTRVRMHLGKLQRSPEGHGLVSIFTEDGLVLDHRSSAEYEVPRGRVHVVVRGEDGDYVREYALDVGEAELVLEVPDPGDGPSLALAMSEAGDTDGVLAQLGRHFSFSEPGPPLRDGSWIYHASSGARPALAVFDAHGGVRLARLDPDPRHQADLRATFEGPDCLVVPPVETKARITIPWQGEAGEAGRCAPQRATVWPVLLGSLDLEDGQAFELPEGRLYYAEFGAEGALPRHVLGRARAGEDQRVELVRRAHLSLDGDIAGLASWEGALERSKTGFTLEQAPGPLLLRVRHRDGNVSLVSLLLAQGESRVLVVE